MASAVFRFGAGNRIHTENSCKYDVDEVIAVAAPAWTPLHVWSDPAEWFSVFLFGGEDGQGPPISREVDKPRCR